MVTRTVACKLAPDAAAETAIRDSAVAFAVACNYVLAVALREKVSNQFKLHHLAYYDVRKRFGLPANLAVRAIARVAGAIKSAKRKGRKPKAFRPTSIDYDAKIFAYREADQSVALTTVAGRIRVPLALGDYQRDALRGKKPTAAKVALRDRALYVHIAIDEAPAERPEPTCAIGIDRGIYNLAVTSTGKFFSGREAMHKREKFTARRATLQAKGTKSAKRALKRLSGREARWMRDVNHVVSKAIVGEAATRNAEIKMEDLHDIRERTRRFSRVWNRKLNAWAFRQLGDFVEYKAARAGLRVTEVPARNTSRTCPRCKEVDKHSRSGAHFQCVFCGYRLAADYAAAKTVAEGHARPARVAVSRPTVAGTLHSCILATSPGLKSGVVDA